MTLTSNSELTAEQVANASTYLAETRDALVASATGLPPSQWEFKPAPDRWSIGEIVEHLVLIEDRIHTIIGRIGDAPEPPPGWNQSQVDHAVVANVPKRSDRVQAPVHVTPANRWNAAETLRRFVEARERTLQLLLSATALRGHVIPHPVLGPWDGYQWLLAAAAHSARHTDQIREVKGAPGFPQPA
jgi:DinB family protein